MLMPTWPTPTPRDDTWTSRCYSASTAACWYFRSIMVLSSGCLLGLALVTLVVRGRRFPGAPPACRQTPVSTRRGGPMFLWSWASLFPYALAPLCPCSPTPGYRPYARKPVFPWSGASLFPYALAPLFPYAGAPLFPCARRPCSHTPGRHCSRAPISPCSHKPFPWFGASLFPCASLRPCSHAPVSPCSHGRSVTVPMRP